METLPVAIHPPGLDSLSRLLQRREPVLIRALVAQLSVSG
jgi:hypothetical protein